VIAQTEVADSHWPLAECIGDVFLHGGFEAQGFNGVVLS